MWEKMLAHAEEFDFSNYPVDSRHRSAENPHLRGNTKRINVMKDEMGMAPILEYVGLRAKVYSLLVAPKVVAKMENFVPVKCKGANQPVFYHLPMLIYSQIRRFKILHFFKKTVSHFRCGKGGGQASDSPRAPAEVSDRNRQDARHVQSNHLQGSPRDHHQPNKGIAVRVEACACVCASACVRVRMLAHPHRSPPTAHAHPPPQVGLCSFDDKRFSRSSVQSSAFGNWRILEDESSGLLQ